jgi:hypothetical protein
LDWFGLFPQGAIDSLQGLVLDAWVYVNCTQTASAPAPTGTCSFTVPRGIAPGAYELRLFRNDDFIARLSATPLQVKAVPSSVALSATLLWWGEQEDVAIVHVQWSGIDPVTLLDWFGVYPSGTPDTEFNWWTYSTWAYLSCGHQPGTTILRPSGDCYFPIDPNLPIGTYEVRLFANDGFTRLGVSSFSKFR